MNYSDYLDYTESGQTLYNISDNDYSNDSISDNISYYHTNYSSCPMSSFDEEIHVYIYALYALMFVVSVIGNGVVCYIVIATPRMRTVTNYFIANLAIGEMLTTLMCVPFTSIAQIQNYWPFYSILCPVSATAQAVSVFVCAYTLVAISIDRYVAIMWPLQPRLSKKSAALVIVAVWFFACFTVSPLPMVNKTIQPREEYVKCNMYLCTEDWSDFGNGYSIVFTQTLLILQYVVPVSVLLFTYTNIAVVIWCHRIPGEAEDGRDLRIARSKRKMIKMMVAVVLVYTICWLPLNIFLIMHDMGVSVRHPEIIWLASHLLAMSHPCYNPIIYCYMNNRFRQGFIQIFGILLPCCRRVCSNAAMIHNNGRSRMSIPLTSTGRTDSTTLHRNNTCTTYISMRRRTGNSISGGSSGGHEPTNLLRHPRPTKIQFSNVNESTTSIAGNEVLSQSDNYSHAMPVVRAMSGKRLNLGPVAQDANSESYCLLGQMRTARQSTRKRDKQDKSPVKDKKEKRNGYGHNLD